MSYNEFLPSYSIGDDCYKEIPYVTRCYGKTAVVIGGKTAMEKAKPELLAALKGSDLEITDFIWYGGDSNYENIEMLKAMPEVQNADMVFACRDKDMTHTPLLGRVLAEACTKPLVSYGKKALEDCRNNVSSKNIEQIALDIIITTGLV